MHQEPSYASAAAVAGLAREVEALRRGIESMRVLPGRVEEVAALVARLAEATAGRSTRQTGSGAPTWLELHEDLHRPMGAPGAVEDAEQLLTRLAGWMGGVYLRYADAARTLPACWLWHPEVVEELLWLHAAWLAAYADPDAVISQAADWHDRMRPGVVRRVKQYAGMCSIENHQPGRDRDTPAVRVPLADAVGLIATWWAISREDAAPTPTAIHVAEVSTLRPRNGLRGRA